MHKNVQYVHVMRCVYVNRVYIYTCIAKYAITIFKHLQATSNNTTLSRKIHIIRQYSQHNPIKYDTTQSVFFFIVFFHCESRYDLKAAPVSLHFGFYEILININVK